MSDSILIAVDGGVFYALYVYCNPCASRFNLRQCYKSWEIEEHHVPSGYALKCVECYRLLHGEEGQPPIFTVDSEDPLGGRMRFERTEFIRMAAAWGQSL